MKMLLELSREDIEKELKGFPVMVEMWSHLKDSMSKRKKYEEEFNKTERGILYKYYKIFYDWYLRSGVPDTTSMDPNTLILLQRAINFFGEL